MIKFYTMALLSLSLNGYSQFDSYNLDFNNTAATVSNGGVFFNQSDIGSPGYEVPVGSGHHGIYALSFWFGGRDTGGGLKLAATNYNQLSDFFPGALTTDGSADLPLAETVSKGIYLVTKAEIDYHILHAGEVDYMMPESIVNWPAHGDVSYELDFYLAPFVDVDGDGIYNPAIGDYPKIKGDKAIYLIVNDKGGVHESGGEPIGLEIHYLIYQYASDDFLNNTTYISMRLINRGTQTLFDFKTACFMDCDLGESTNDFVGFNADADVMYCYNGTNSDAQYGANPPAIGVALLNREVHKFAAIGDAGPTGLPATAPDYYSYMNGKWRDGTPFTYGGNGYGGDVETDFLYDGLPTTPSWNEVALEHLPGDRRMMMSTGPWDGTLRPFDELCFEYAVLYSRVGNNLENAVDVVDLAEDARNQLLLDGGYSCNNAVASIDKPKMDKELNSYPNPSNGSFQIQAEGNFDVEIYSLDGRLVYSQLNLVGNTPIETHLTSGTYLMVIDQNGKKNQSKIVIRN